MPTYIHRYRNTTSLIPFVTKDTLLRSSARVLFKKEIVVDSWTSISYTSQLCIIEWAGSFSNVAVFLNAIARLPFASQALIANEPSEAITVARVEYPAGVSRDKAGSISLGWVSLRENRRWLGSSWVEIRSNSSRRDRLCWVQRSKSPGLCTHRSWRRRTIHLKNSTSIRKYRVYCFFLYFLGQCKTLDASVVDTTI